MYLARVEMTGFKSFADKTVIEFDRGMTAVVGPNGSGKSNLSEAIRWVLGEQSAKSLRGSKMEDVIFNGTQNRKAVNLAKVTLVLNNEDRYLDYDFSEISITRSYNRNGDSHYFINNEQVRLKDIVDLLLDSGLGKNSFAMISQGKVESIFLNKPEERRSIFEEAAGVQKYQFRKQEAERKLTRSSDHLSRVRDIIHELSLQLKPLKAQQEAALVYIEQKEMLQQLEIALYCYQIEQYRTQWEQAIEQDKTITTEIEQLNQVLVSIEAQLEQEQSALDALMQTIDEQSETSQAQVQVIEQTRARQQMLQQQIQFNTSSLQEKQLSYEQYVAQQTQLTAQLTSLAAQQVEVASALEAIQAHTAQLSHEKSALSGLSEDQVESLRAQLIDAYQLEATANNQIKQHDQQLNYSTQRLAHYQAQADGVVDTLASLQADGQQAHTQYEHLMATQRTQQQAYQQLSEQVQQVRMEREQLQQALFQQERQQQLFDSKVQSLQQLQEDYAGYYAGVKAIMKQAKQLSGIEGTVADLITVPAEYQVALDTALGASVQHVVVMDDRAAREAIQYLKQQHAGRATFLPRTNIKPRHLAAHIAQTAQQHAGYIGVAAELVQYESQNQAIVSSLLGTTIVCDRIQSAQQLAKALNQQVKIVTLDGEVLMPGGAITGGRQKQQTSSMLGRQQELQNAQKLLQEATAHKLSLENQWQQLNSQGQLLQTQLDEARQALNQADLAVQQQQQQVAQLAQQVKHQENTRIIAQDEVQQLTQAVAESQVALTNAHEQAETAKALIQQLSHDLEQLNLSAEDRQQQLQVIESSLSHYTTQEAVKRLEAKQLRQQQEQITVQLNEIDTFLAQHQNLADQSTLDLAELEQTLVEVEATLAELEAQSAQSRETLQTLREQRTTLNQDYRQHEQEERELQSKAQKAYKAQATYQAQIEKFDSLIDSHLDYLSQEYQLSFEAAKAQATEVDDMSQVSQQVKQIKRRIEQLGPINLAAIDDYAALDTRYQHLVEQETDLLTAMSQLQETMDEMDSEVIKRFSETFNQINHQFQRTFKRLFAGGEAALQLTDPNDLLTSGIDIVAQPPGKRKQHLALLSGGERAFTAIALLFAILETRPVPFCVLDEVEAALDDANVYRYGQYLQNFTESTQFIVITHRKGTMEHADVLYGVTMEQSGVSKLASVRLSEADYE